jgi:putative ABC transport system permease protein
VATYLKVALRTLYREKLYAALNIGGLALAVACALVIGLYLRSELTYDRHNALHDRLFRVANELTIKGNTSRIAVTSPPLGGMLAANYPEVLAFTRFQRASVQPMLLRHGDDAAYWSDVYFADDNVFDLFTHEIIRGDPKTALKDPASVAVSETFARRYFGDENPIGQTIENDSGVPVKITLVFADLPANSHLKYDALFSFRRATNPPISTPWPRISTRSRWPAWVRASTAHGAPGSSRSRTFTSAPTCSSIARRAIATTSTDSRPSPSSCCSWPASTT